MWNNRIIKHTDGSYGLYEVIYNDDNEIAAHDSKPTIVGDSVDELIQSLQMMLSDIDKCKHDILDIDKITFAPLYDENDEFVEFNIEDLSDNDGV